jgi:DNA-binding NarL/FixJ family response regulator
VRYRVISEYEFDVASPSEAAFLAYKASKSMAISDASFSVLSDMERFERVTVAQSAPFEMLTDREHQVAKLVMSGADNASIAGELGITCRTVKAHVAHMFDKLGVPNRVSMATLLLRAHRKSQAVAQ